MRISDWSSDVCSSDLLVGADPASEIYVRNKRLTCEKVGVRSVPMHFAADIGEAELLAAIDALNADDDIDGILVQLPLPGHINAIRVTERIRADKDVDGFHPYNIRSEEHTSELQ